MRVLVNVLGLCYPKSHHVIMFSISSQRWWSGPGPGQCWFRHADCPNHGAPQSEGLFPSPHYLCLLHSYLHHLHSSAT